MTKTYDIARPSPLAAVAIQKLRHAAEGEWSASISPLESDALLTFIEELEESAEA